MAEDDDNNGNVTKSSTSSVARSKNDQPDTPKYVHVEDISDY